MKTVSNKVSFPGLAFHPFLARSYTGVLTEFFTKLLLSQNIFSTEERNEKILDMIPDPDQSITSELLGRWQERDKPLVQVSLTEFVSEAEQKEIELHIPLTSSGSAAELCISLSLLELTTT